MKRFIGLFGILLMGVIFNIAGVEAQKTDDSALLWIDVGGVEISESVDTFLLGVAERLVAQGVVVTFDEPDEDQSEFHTIQITDIRGTDDLILVNLDMPSLEISRFLQTQTRYSTSLYLDLAQESEAILAGMGMYLIGRCEEAIDVLDDAITLLEQTMSPENNGQSLAVNARFYAGNCMLVQHEMESAKDYYLESLKSPYFSDFSTVRNLAWVYLQLGAEEQAFQVVTDAMNNAVGFSHITDLKATRAELYGLAFDYDRAIDDMNDVIEFATDNSAKPGRLAELYTLRAQIIFLIYEWDRVLEDLNTAITLAPDYEPAYFQRGVLHYTMAQREAALADFEHYLTLTPNGLDADHAKDYIESLQIELNVLNGD